MLNHVESLSFVGKISVCSFPWASPQSVRERATRSPLASHAASGNQTWHLKPPQLIFMEVYSWENQLYKLYIIIQWISILALVYQRAIMKQTDLLFELEAGDFSF